MLIAMPSALLTTRLITRLTAELNGRAVALVVAPLAAPLAAVIVSVLVALIPSVCLAGNQLSSPGQLDKQRARQAVMHDDNVGSAGNTNVSIAFLPDIHFHDIHADLGLNSFPGVPDPQGGPPLILRTMQAQASSTRLFNESYFALHAALDDVVARGIDIVVLNGDLADDGQPVHMDGLKQRLLRYQKQYGLDFFILPGNHDINRPFAQPAGKGDYLGRDPTSGSVGYAQAVASPGYRLGDSPTSENTVYWTPAVREMGYADLTHMMAPFGVVPKPEYLYYETPYSDYTPASYSFEKAWQQASLLRRQYQVCQHDGNASSNAPNNAPEARTGHPTRCKAVADLSYLVEPRKDVWLLMIDANVFVPSGEGENDFTPAGNAGFNRMVTHKAHVIDWMQRVAERAAASGKRLVTSSHYPALDWMKNRGDKMAYLFGNDFADVARRPSNETGQRIASTGVRLHIGGHMHNNATTVRDTHDGTPPLVNVQVSALGAYAPAYKVVTLQGHNEEVMVETVPLVEVKGFSTLFPLYRDEHAYLCERARTSKSAVPLWPRSLLEASDYRDFTRRHLEALITVRYSATWPPLMQTLMSSQLSGIDLLTLAAMQHGPTMAALGQPPIATQTLRTLLQSQNDATALAQSWTRASGMQLADFERWSVRDVINDLMRLHLAGGLALDDIPQRRLAQYAVLTGLLDTAPGIHRREIDTDTASGQVPFAETFQAYFHPLMHVLLDLAASPTSKRIAIDLETGTIRSL